MRDSFQTGLLSVVCFLGLLSAACPFGRSGSSDLRPIGPGVQADVLVYFNSGLSQDEINTFSKDVLSKPDPEGRGYDHPPGVRTFLRLHAVEGHEGIALTFFPDATKEQREELLKSIKASPVVYKILENTTPHNVKTLK